MSAASRLLDIPELRARVSPVTVAQYHQFPERNERGHRTELIRGLVIEKMSKSPLHSGIASLLYDLIRPQVPHGFWLRKEEPLTLEDSEPEPDLSLVHGERSEFTGGHPATATLVVEIAVSSAAEDRSLATMYAEAGVDEYCIVLAPSKQIEVYRQPSHGTYSERFTATGDATLESGSAPAIRLRLRDLFA